jgi:hypothetical protein
MSVASPGKLIETYAQVGAANQRAMDKLTAVVTQFRAHGIDCLLLKGADVLSRLYGVWGIRPMADLDLLVHEHDLPAIDRIVTHLGYRPVIDGNPGYAAPDESLVLDLVTEIWYADDTETIWRRAVQRNMAGLPVKSMGADDLLIYLAAYSVLNRGYFPPSFSKDIALLVGKEPLNWEFIFDEAVRHNLKIPLHHGLSYAAQQEAVPVPDSILARFAPSTKSETALAFILRKLVTQTPVDGAGHFLLLIFQPGMKKWRRLRQAFWPSPAFLKYRYGERGETFPVRTRLARAMHLTIQAHRLLGHILYRLVT